LFTELFIKSYNGNYRNFVEVFDKAGGRKWTTLDVDSDDMYAPLVDPDIMPILEHIRTNCKVKYHIGDITRPNILDKIRKVRPDIALSSDFIVGYPDETDNDFSDTMKFIEKVKYVIAYSFIYSPRPGTPAQKKDNIDINLKKARLTALQSLLKDQQINYNKSFINKKLEVLFEKNGRHKNQFVGRTIYNQSAFTHSSTTILNKIMNVQITNSTNFSLECQI